MTVEPRTGLSGPNARPHLKDEALDNLARTANVAQFVSFRPGTPEIRYCRMLGVEHLTRYEPLESAVRLLLERSPEASVNVRSFVPGDENSRQFIYGLTSVDEVAAVIRRLSADGSYTIVNETIDVHDGGVSGVALGDLIEFAPDDTPRCVEKPGTAALPRTLGVSLLETVYGFTPQLDYPQAWRVEFSLHPIRRGTRQEHTIIWEIEQFEPTTTDRAIRWPNRFSTFLGDKAYGLLIAHFIGLRVPRTTVLSRRVAPFSFGAPTNTDETWLRTCPSIQIPGKFTTRKGWTDPFDLLNREDPTGEVIPSVLAQDAVHADFSGVLAGQSDGELLIEGVRGSGEAFMGSGQPPESLPQAIREEAGNSYLVAQRVLGPVRFEWVADGSVIWVVQLHIGATESAGNVIFPGSPKQYHRFPVDPGQEDRRREELRRLVDDLDPERDGVILVADVGIASHFGDILRRARIPSVLERPSWNKTTEPQATL